MSEESECDRWCESPHFAAACASVGIEHQRSTASMAAGIVCETCPLRPGIAARLLQERAQLSPSGSEL